MTVCNTLPHPSDAVSVGTWENLDNDWGVSGPFRAFTGSSWVVPAAHDATLDWLTGDTDVRVQIEGIQRANGSVKRWVTVTGGVGLLPPAMVRMLSQSLADAHAEIVRHEGKR